MSNFPFSRIVMRDPSASIVYEDEQTKGFLDVLQCSTAHVLVLPKQHVETIRRQFSIPR